MGDWEGQTEKGEIKMAGARIMDLFYQ